MIDMKLVFLAVAFIAISYRTEVNNDSDYYATCVCQKFFIKRDQLYKFVTSANMVGMWVDSMPAFMSADQKPLGVGKLYKADSLNDAALFRVTDFHEGNYVAVESNFLLRPRVEFYFFEVDSRHINGNCSWHLKSSQLEIRLTFKRTSALFQHTIGATFRVFIRRELKRSLKNLQAILVRSSTFPGAFP